MVDLVIHKMGVLIVQIVEDRMTVYQGQRHGSDNIEIWITVFENVTQPRAGPASPAECWFSAAVPKSLQAYQPSAAAGFSAKRGILHLDPRI